MKCLLLGACALLLAGLPAAAQSPAVPTSRELIHLSFAPVVKKVAPAVVNVFSRRVVRTAEGPAALFNDPLFRRFFGNRMPSGVPRERVENSLGSGVILDAAGFVVTNHHVIKDAQEVLVVLPDRREFEAKIVLADEHADLAVLRIDAHGEKLPALQLGDSDALEVGDLVLAIGNPFGVGQTVTSGIVSGLARTIGANDFRSFIQTDAAINPGNSGGALVDLDGRVVGINAAIFSQSGGSIGIGFAIPASLVRGVLQAAVSGRKITRPWLGATGQGVTAEIAQSLSLPRPEGVLLNTVVPGGPRRWPGSSRATSCLRSRATRSTIPTGCASASPSPRPTRRCGSRCGAPASAATSSRTLVPPPDLPPRELTRLSGREPLSGAAIANLNPAFAEELGIDSAQRGVIVTALDEGGLAERLGIEPGDILVSLNKQPIESVAQLQRLLAAAGPPWVVTVKRGDKLLSTPPLRE